jgi:VWFA-related protein
MKAAAGIFIGALLASGQQPAAPTPVFQRPEPIFAVTSALVQVDAVVTDSKGHHITDLTPEDFQVFEDGKPQTLTHFSYVQVTPERKAAPEVKAAGPKPSSKTASALPPAPLAQIRPEDVRRTIVLMVDDLGLSFNSMAFVRWSLRKFVINQMQPGDLVAVCRTGGGSGVLQQFTVDKRVLLSIIDGLRWNPVPSGAEGSGFSTIAAIMTLDYIVGALREVPGRKSIVLLSDGFATVWANADDPGAALAFQRLLDHANRSATVIYTMQTTALWTGQPDAQAPGDLGLAAKKLAPTAENINAELANTHVDSKKHKGENIQQQNLAYVAARTGGLAYENGNDLNWGLDRVLEDQAGYYLLGYHPPESTLEGSSGGRDFHRIQVTVKRAGLHVRSRSGFFGETDEETLPKHSTPIERLHAAMLSPFQNSGVGVRLTALYAEVPKHGPVVRNLMRIDVADLTWKHDADGSDEARILLLAAANSASGRPLAEMSRPCDLRIAPGQMKTARRDGALYVLDVPVPERGAYQIRVAVEDQATARIGSATQFLEIPDLKKTGFALTSVVLGHGANSADKSGQPDIAAALRQFKRGSSLEFLCVVENGSKNGLELVLDARVRIVRDGKEVYSAPARLIDVRGGKAVFGALKLADAMSPGDYDLQVMAAKRSDSKGPAIAQWTDFTVLP